MAKKTAPKANKTKARAVRKAGGKQTAFERQLVGANQDLKAVYETEHQWRLDLLKANEDLSRETVGVEAEIRRLQQQELQLKKTIAELQDHRAQLSSTGKELSRQSKELRRQRNAARIQCDGLAKNVKALTQEKGSLLKKANDLGKQLGKLKSDVERLETIRKQYLSEIAKFRTQKAKLVGR